MNHFLQSSAWEAFQHQLGRKTLRNSGDDWSYMAINEQSRIAPRLYAPYGPVIQSSGALESATQSMLLEARRAGSTYIRIEPTGAVTADDLRGIGYQKVKAAQPEHTWCIDLKEATVEELVTQMSQPNRNIYRNYQNKGLVLHTSTNSDDITILTTLLRSVASRNTIQIHSDSYFHTQAEVLMRQNAAVLYYVTFENEPIAAALVYDSDMTRYYAHAAASYAHRKLNPGAVIVSSLII
ncbi:MAG: peptidoglycan bridge formation glycyltransferase FemA/FemB family protein, partial [Chloroflexi bacterium]